VTSGGPWFHISLQLEDSRAPIYPLRWQGWAAIAAFVATIFGPSTLHDWFGWQIPFLFGVLWYLPMGLFWVTLILIKSDYNKSSG
jgi:hypothetical protein